MTVEENLVSLEYKSTSNGLDYAEIRICRPKALNALNMKVISELDALFTKVEKRQQQEPLKVRALVLRGDGGKAFAAGADLVELDKMTAEEAAKHSRKTQKIFGRLEKMPFATVAYIDGFALGGGCELAMCCDIMIGTEAAQLGQPEALLGLLPGFGGTARLAQRVGKAKALELLYSGERVSAKEAKEIGLLQHVLVGAKVEDNLHNYIEKLLLNSGPCAISLIKRIVKSVDFEDLDRVCQQEAQAFAEAFKTEDKQIGVQAFLKKEKALFVAK